MKTHTRIYLESFGFEPIENIYIPCEIGKNEWNKCQNKATDIHHIEARGMGGSKKKDRIENLMALCRNCHNDYGDIKDLMKDLYTIHKARMESSNVEFDSEYIDNQINRYD